MEEQKSIKTAAEAGWHLSKYNISARLADEGSIIVVNLLKGSCTKLGLADLVKISDLDRLNEDDPVLKKLSKRGIIVNFDERALLETMARGACAYPSAVGLTISPTLGCNFDCPYCFENHRAEKMSGQVQNDVVHLAERMLDASGAKKLSINWFGGEPLLAPEIIKSLSERLILLAEEKKASYAASIVTNGYLLDQKIADMLKSSKVSRIQITLDGIGAVHDATRHLVGGGQTFVRITENLRNVKISGKVLIRHNVHQGNKAEAEKLKSYIAKLAEESGNDLCYYQAPVIDSVTAENRGKQVDLLCESENDEVSMTQMLRQFRPGSGHFCGANSLWNVGIDPLGNLQKCWEDTDKPEHSFGTAANWDPMNPLFSADHPDWMTVYLNTSGALDDQECRSCIWLPACRGGCPNHRLFYKRACVPYKDEPAKFALAVYRKIQGQKNPSEVKQESYPDTVTENATF